MTDQPPAQPPAEPPIQLPGVSPSLIARVQNILLRPQPEWQVIKGEPATVRGLFTNYAMLLAAIPAVAGFISNLFPFNLVGGIVMAAFLYVGTLGATYLTGLVVDFLAPSFGSEKDTVGSMKTAVYSMTPTWVGGIVLIIPVLGFSLWGLANLYSLAQLFFGIQAVKGTPQDKAILHTLVTALIVGVAVGIVISIFISVTAMLAVGAALARAGH